MAFVSITPLTKQQAEKKLSESTKLKKLSASDREAIRRHILEHVNKKGGVPTGEIKALKDYPELLLYGIKGKDGHLNSVFVPKSK
jgi:hypothetical protein